MSLGDKVRASQITDTPLPTTLTHWGQRSHWLIIVHMYFWLCEHRLLSSDLPVLSCYDSCTGHYILLEIVTVSSMYLMDYIFF